MAPERGPGWNVLRTLVRILVWILAVLLLVPVAIQLVLRLRPIPPERKVAWGVTFSQKQCASLGVDWRAAYAATLSELRPAGLRLIAYWDLLEPAPGREDFRDLDWQVAQAEKAGITVVLAIGRKTPRWPECHEPRWVEGLDAEGRRAALLRHVTKIVERYRGSPALLYWQVENEPFVDFGTCGPLDEALLREEVRLVRQLDPEHPILMTDSGEVGWWPRVAELGDAVGFTLYRQVHNDRIGSFPPPLTPEYFEFKGMLTRRVTGRPALPLICVELAAEPWGEKAIADLSFERQAELFSPEAFDGVVRFARETGYDTFYFWGVEWWYFRNSRGDPAYWDRARDRIASGRRSVAVEMTVGGTPKPQRRAVRRAGD